MKLFPALLLILLPTLAFSQKLVVETVKLTETTDHKDVSDIPRVRDTLNPNSPVANKINSQIMDRFMIDTYDQSKLEDFTWFGVTFTSEMKSGILHIAFSGEYVAAYPNEVTDEFYFDLSTGDELTKMNVPFQSLLTLSGYLDFLNKYWLPGAKDAFRKAMACAGGEQPYCSLYDIDSYTVQDRKLTITLTGDCYEHAVQSCNPQYTTTVPVDSVGQYLNETGLNLLLQGDYFSKSPIDQFIANKKLVVQLPENRYYFGKVDNKYPFSMALNFDGQRNVKGYYYYDKSRQPITLEGLERTDGTLTLTETSGGKVTGQFDLKYITDYDQKGIALFDAYGNNEGYLVGKWMNPDKTKVFDIYFTEVKWKDSR